MIPASPLKATKAIEQNFIIIKVHLIQLRSENSKPEFYKFEINFLKNKKISKTTSKGFVIRIK